MSAHEPAAHYPKAHRLTTPRQYALVVRSRIRGSTKCFKWFASSNGSAYARLGVTVSRRVSGRAVDRNRIKRIIRESFRRRSAELAGLDVVVVALPVAGTLPNLVLHDRLAALWQSVRRHAIITQPH